MTSKFTDLPFEVLLQIFKLYIDSTYDPEMLLQWNVKRPPQRQQVPIRRFVNPCAKPQPSAIAKRRGTIRLVCKTFMSVIDSSSYWAGRTFVAPCTTIMDKRRWGSIEACTISSLELKGVATTSHSYLCSLRGLSNLKHFSFNCHQGINDFKLLSCLSNCKLQSLEVRDIGVVSFCLTMIDDDDDGIIECGNLMLQLAIFKQSLKKITLIRASSSKRHYKAPGRQHHMIREMKKILPLLRNIVFKNFGAYLLVSGEYDEFRGPLQMVECLQVIMASFGVMSSSTVWDEEEYVVGNEGQFHLKKIFTLYDECMVKRKDNIIDLLVQGNLKNLRSLEIGHQWEGSPSGKNLTLMLSKVRNLNELKLHSQNMLENKAVDQISANSRTTLKVLWFDDCKNIDDHCLFDLKARFPSLTHLTVTECRDVKGTFLSQNYQSISTMPRLQYCKCYLNEKDSEFVVNIFKRMRQMTNNKIELWLL
eukprot:Seg6136.1 transcript_id=Seg6136.1/GoldUCD/mRNA.D3Y31 product="hypothetical protein" protein_id=Seg6136.1/GoldUCD/D3Y31